ncbi:MAG: GldG family protein [Verrucomicrobiota bacterium]
MNLNSKEGAAGLTALLTIAIVITLNFLVGGLGFLNGRFDVTEDRLYTLSDGTRNILDRLNPDEPVTIRYYVTTEDRVMPPVLKTHARMVQDLILEFQKAGKQKVILEKLAPNPNTEDEDKAREDEVQGVPINNEGDNVYLGLAIQCGKQKEVLPFLNPNEETALEYNISRAIQKVSKEKKTVVGVMSSMPILGSPMYPFQKQQGQQPWVLIQRLRMDYEVREVQMGASSIDSDINVLVVVHPADITELSEYAIDQYLLKGGQVVALVDPQCLVAQRVYSQQQNPMTGQPGGVINPSSDLPNLFKAWGVGYNKSDIVADVNYRSQLMGRQTAVALRLPNEALNKKERITSDLQSLLFMMSGAFDVNPKDGVTATTLAASSEASDLVDSTEAEKMMREPVSNFSSSGKKQTLAVMLKGKFKTAFPGGKPAPAPEKPSGMPPGGPTGFGMPPGGYPGMPPREGGGAQDDANAPKTSATPAPAPAAAVPAPAPAAPAAPAPAPGGLSIQPTAPAPGDAKKDEVKKDEAKPAEPAKPTDGTILESQNAEGVVMLFADADMMYDAFAVQQDPMTGGLVAVDGNLPMFLNSVEILSGGGDLLQVRSRASTRRPFTKMDELRENVEKQFRPSLTEKQTEMDKIAEKIGPLKVKNGQIVVDPAQAKQIQDLTLKRQQLQKEVREIKKDQNKDIDFTENMITLLNVLGVPLLVVVIGLTLAMRRRSTTAAA